MMSSKKEKLSFDPKDVIVQLFNKGMKKAEIGEILETYLFCSVQVFKEKFRWK